MPQCNSCRDRLTSDTWYISSQAHGQYTCKSCLKRTQRERLKANPRKTEYSMLANAKHRAKRDGLPFNLTLGDITIPTHCPVLGVPLQVNPMGQNSSSPSLDKIIPELGYVRGNIAVISSKANRIKSDASLEELKAVTKWLSEQVVKYPTAKI